MSKAKTLASIVADGGPLADGQITAADIGGLTLPSGGDIVGTTATQTLTNKIISYADNTLTNVVGVTATQSLTNKTLVDPIITLGGSEGTAGQVLLSQGSGQPGVWETFEAGGSIQITAEGNIPKGYVVTVNDDGTGSVPQINAIASPSETQYNASIGGSNSCTATSNESNLICTVYWDAVSKWYVQFGYVLVNNKISFLQPIELTGFSAPIDTTNQLVKYHPPTNAFIFLLRTTTAAAAVAFKYDGEVFQKGTVTALVDSASTNSAIPWDLVYHPTTQNFLYVGSHASVAGPHGAVLTCDANLNIALAGTLTKLTTNTIPTTVKAAYDPVSDRFLTVAGWRDGGTQTKNLTYYSSASITSNSVTEIATLLHSTAVGVTGDAYGTPAYDSIIQRFVVVTSWWSGGAPRGWVVNISGPSITVSTLGSVYSATFTGFSASPVFNPKDNRMYVATGTELVRLNTATTGVSVDALVCAWTSSNGGSHKIISGSAGLSFFYATYNSGPKGYSIALEESTLNYNRILGVAAGDYSDGETATIKVVGSTADLDYDVVIGREYYSGFDGKLAAVQSPTLEANGPVIGLGLTTSRILVKGV